MDHTALIAVIGFAALVVFLIVRRFRKRRGRYEHSTPHHTVHRDRHDHRNDNVGGGDNGGI